MPGGYMFRAGVRRHRQERLARIQRRGDRPRVQPEKIAHAGEFGMLRHELRRRQRLGVTLLHIKACMSSPACIELAHRNLLARRQRRNIQRRLQA